MCVSPIWVVGINRWWPLQYFHFFAENWVFLVMVCKHVGQQLVQICFAQTRGWWLLWPEIHKWKVSIICFHAYQTTFVLCAIIETKSYEQLILHVCMYVWMYICNSPCWQNMILVFDLSLWICYKITSLFSRQLVFHIFADLLQSSLNDFRVHYNCRKIRKQNGLSLPSGHSPNVMWGSPHIFDENASK